MTPAARIAAAIGIVDAIAAGSATEAALLRWARGARYAGSKDRAAVRDLVFDVRRRWLSTAHDGGGDSGRARLIGLLRQQGVAAETLFTGDGFGPAALSDGEAQMPHPAPADVACDMPAWIMAQLTKDHGAARANRIAQATRERAPVFLRVNPLRGSLAEAVSSLERDGIAVRPHDAVPLALEVLGGQRGIARSAAYLGGLVELQDAASQAVVAALPLRPGQRVLDYCAGGGGKALAIAAALGGGPVEAHDADPARMGDLPARAARAGADITPFQAPCGPYDLVFCDAPCSGSGSWRRAPDGKWTLSRARLEELTRIQRSILDTAAPLVAENGALAYATCSVFDIENGAQVSGFARENGWAVVTETHFFPGADGDGFYLGVLTRP